MNNLERGILMVILGAMTIENANTKRKPKLNADVGKLATAHPKQTTPTRIVNPLAKFERFFRSI